MKHKYFLIAGILSSLVLAGCQTAQPEAETTPADNGAMMQDDSTGDAMMEDGIAGDAMMGEEATESEGEAMMEGDSMMEEDGAAGADDSDSMMEEGGGMEEDSTMDSGAQM